MTTDRELHDTTARPNDDMSVMGRIGRLVTEEHRLFEEAELSHEDARRLAEVQVELDRCWDLLRQRRALREFGRDPSEAHVRSAEVVKKYIG